MHHPEYNDNSALFSIMTGLGLLYLLESTYLKWVFIHTLANECCARICVLTET